MMLEQVIADSHECAEHYLAAGAPIMLGDCSHTVRTPKQLREPSEDISRGCKDVPGLPLAFCAGEA